MGSVRTARDIDAALHKKGFRRETDGKHIHYFFRDPEGGKSGIFTLMSHGMAGSSLSANLLSQMARQLRLSKPRFLDLINCSLDENEYTVAGMGGRLRPLSNRGLVGPLPC